jgi:hypothetical protein
MRRTFLYTGILAAIVIFFTSLSYKPDDVGFENLQVLPGNTNKYQMDSIMNHFTVALGVNCDFCHVQLNNEMKDWDFANDSKHKKTEARAMMRMTNDINQKYFNIVEPGKLVNRLEVTCYSCHGGRKHPARAPKKSAP